MPKYLMIQGSPDGCYHWIEDEAELQRIFQNPKEHGVSRFLDDLPSNKDPNYWKNGATLILEVSGIMVPNPLEG